MQSQKKRIQITKVCAARWSAVIRESKRKEYWREHRTHSKTGTERLSRKQDWPLSKARGQVSHRVASCAAAAVGSEEVPCSPCLAPLRTTSIQWASQGERLLRLLCTWKMDILCGQSENCSEAPKKEKGPLHSLLLVSSAIAPAQGPRTNLTRRKAWSLGS